jgi:hypothetical protein
MAGSPRKKARQEGWNKIMADPDFWDRLFVRVASDMALREYAAAMEVSFNFMYTRLNDTPELRQRLDDALKAKAWGKMEKISERIVRVDNGEMDHQVARTSNATDQWLMERLDNERWGSKQHVKVEQVDLGKMHLEEMKRLNNPDVIEGEVVRGEDDG